MIILTRLGGQVFAQNVDLIDRLSENPDTTILLVDGSTLVVTETMEEVRAAIRDSRASVLAAALKLLRDGEV